MKTGVESLNVNDFIKELSQEVASLKCNSKVINVERYNIRSKITRYKDDPGRLEDSSRSPSCELASVRKRKDCLKMRDSNLLYKRKFTQVLKYAFSDAPWKHAMLKKQLKLHQNSSATPTKAKEEWPHSLPEVIITLNYHKPVMDRKKLAVFRQIQVLGSTLLTQLRDVLPCISDEVLTDPVKSLEEKGEVGRQTAKMTYKSGYLFIDNVFYNDFRNPQNIDYSRVVRDWADKNKLDSLKSLDMNGVKFQDVSFKQNQMYLYCHQGNCEHVITFSDIRLLNPLTDITDPHSYPLVTLRRGERKPLCSVCHVESVRWVVVEGRLNPEAPCFFCTACMSMLYCGEDGSLLDADTVVHMYPFNDKEGID